jgi:hypothetical protein
MARQMVFIWTRDLDDDRSVTITCQLGGVEYVHRPLLINHAFPIGERIVVQSDTRLQLQVWAFPFGFCSPTTHSYSAAVSVSNRFTLMTNVTNGPLCLFFDNPSIRSLTVAQTQSRKFDPLHSMIEVWNGAFEQLNCPKKKCRLVIVDKFLVRLIGAGEGLRYYIKAHFQHNEILSVCGRTAIPVWDGNMTYTATLDTFNEELICDAPMRMTRETKAFIKLGVIMFVVLAVNKWLWNKSKKRADASRTPRQLLDQKR